MDEEVVEELQPQPQHSLSDIPYPPTSIAFLHSSPPSSPRDVSAATAAPAAPAAAHTFTPQPSSFTILADTHLPQQYTFPHTLPTVHLTSAERAERYGISEDDLPALVRKECKGDKKWCTIIIHMGRGKEYATAVQQATIDKQLEHVRSFLGFALMKLQISRQHLCLAAVYSNPQHLARFYAYLLARGCARGHVTKHIGIARKVNEYLSSFTVVQSEAYKHHQRVREWLAVLESQVHQAVPSAPPPPDLPLYSQIRRWVLDSCRSALSAANTDLQHSQQLTASSARKVHDAVIMALVTGISIPPLRLDVIKNLNHPNHTAANGCDDVDCLVRAAGWPCLGNRLVIHSSASPDEASTSSSLPPSKTVELVLEHGKNDRRESRAYYKATVRCPTDLVSHLLLLHLSDGLQLLTHNLPDDHTRVFVTGSGRAFSCVTFSQYWAKLMRPASELYGIKPFPPSLARKIFINNYTAKHGVEPDLLEGAAVVMGNTPQQWVKSYNPSRKRRLVDAAIMKHQSILGEEDEMSDSEGSQ